MAVLQYKDKNNKPIKDKQGKSWYFKTYYLNLLGERKQYKSKRFLTKHEAEEAERVFVLSKNNKGNDSSMTFNDLILSYCDFQKDKVKVSSYNNYHKNIYHLRSLLNIKIKDYSINHFNNWKESINKTNLSTITKNNIFKFLKSVINYGKKYLDLDFNNIENKMTSFNNPNELQKDMLFWTYEEFSKFIEQENELKYKAYFETLYYCGLRKGEANALNWNDVDFNNHTLSINKNITLKIKGKEYVILPPKTKSSIRILLIPKKLENDLKMLFKEYSKYSNFKNEWFVFGGCVPLKDSTITQRKSIHCKNAKIKEIRIHDFRHSCASLLIKSGASVGLVAKYLGHSKISTTLNTYTHMFKSEMEDIREIINNL